MKDVKMNNKDSLAKKTGDKIEKVGEKIKNSGARKIGNAVYNAGDKIEHWGEDKKNRK